MSVRVIIKDVKKRTKACDECKRRKGRCDGGMPCEWCSQRNLECAFSAFSQKRGPKKKRRENESDNEEEQEVLMLDKREQGLSSDMELNSYLDVFMKYIDPMFTMFTHWEKGSRMNLLTHPRSYSQFITKYAACAIAARASGQKERATQLITEARSFAGQCFDDMSTDGLLGFFMLASYWIGIDSKVTKHYANIALSIYSTLSPTSMPPNIRYLITMVEVLLNTAIGNDEKVRAYLTAADTIVPQTNPQVLLDAIIRMCMKTFAHMKCFEATLLRSDISAVLCCQVFYTERQRRSILSELKYCRTIAKLCSDLDSQINNVMSTMFVLLEIFVEWRSGHIELALPLAIEFANNCSAETLRFGNRFDVEHLLFLSIFLREQQHPALAEKVRKTADNLHSVVCEALPEFSTSADPLAHYLRRKVPVIDALVSVNPPALPPTHLQDDLDDTAVPTMVSNVLSLVGQLLPSKNSKALLSAQGLHLFHNTLSSIIPPIPSPYDVRDEPPDQSSVPTSAPSSSWTSTDHQPSDSSPITNNPPVYTTLLDSNNPPLPLTPSHRVNYFQTLPMNMSNIHNNLGNISSNNNYNNNFQNNIQFQTHPQQLQKSIIHPVLTTTHINHPLSSFATISHHPTFHSSSSSSSSAYQIVPSTPTTPSTATHIPTHIIPSTTSTTTTVTNARNTGFTTRTTYGIPPGVSSYFVDSGVPLDRINVSFV